ncbi:MAG: hypothetical protein V5A23_09680 [Halobacteriales archaeon]
MTDAAFDRARFARTVGLIGVVTGAFLILAASELSETLSIAVVAIGGVALVTAITAFLIAAAESLDATGN